MKTILTAAILLLSVGCASVSPRLSDRDSRIDLNGGADLRACEMTPREAVRQTGGPSGSVSAFAMHDRALSAHR